MLQTTLWQQRLRCLTTSADVGADVGCVRHRPTWRRHRPMSQHRVRASGNIGRDVKPHRPMSLEHHGNIGCDVKQHRPTSADVLSMSLSRHCDIGRCRCTHWPMLHKSLQTDIVTSADVGRCRIMVSKPTLRHRPMSQMVLTDVKIQLRVHCEVSKSSREL